MPKGAKNLDNKSVLEEADGLINNDRRKAYGPVKESFDKPAKIWSAILGYEVTPEQVGLCMIGLKLSRESYSHKRDNLVDIAGYAALVEAIQE